MRYSYIAYIVRRNIKDKSKFFHPLRAGDEIQVSLDGMICVYTDTGGLLCSSMTERMLFSPGDIVVRVPDQVAGAARIRQAMRLLNDSENSV